MTFSRFLTQPSDSFSKIIWLYFPVALLIAKIGIGLSVPASHIQLFVGENGVYEILQFLMLLPAVGAGLYILAKMDKASKWLFGWIVLATLCCFYVAGEEVSWGQHILKWGTPEFWETFNDQGETNFHNTSSWLDQKPRLLLTIGVYVGGLIIPLLMAFKDKWLPRQYTSIYPTAQFITLAVICLFVKIADKVQEQSGMDIFGRNAEIEEFFLFYFVLMYVFLMKKRLVCAKTPS